MKIYTKGFTLIEILVVIGIIAILASVVIIAINPARQFAQARNSQRQSNVESILNAIGQNMADNKGVFTCGAITLPPSATHIGTASGFTDLSCLTPTYIPSAIPTDPGANGAAAGTAADSQYTIVQDATSKRVTVAAPNAELSQTIAVTR